MKNLSLILLFACASAFAATTESGETKINIKPASVSATGVIRFWELASNGTNYVELKAPTALASNLILILPSSNGTSGQVLTTNGSGTLSWTTVDLANLNADNLTSGTVPLGRLSGITNTEIAAGAAIVDTKLAQIATASKVSTSALTGTLADALFPATLPAVSGANLTNLSAANLIGQIPALDGSLLTALNASNITTGTLQDGIFPATLPTSSGQNLTALNGTNISSGTVADARLSANVTLQGNIINDVSGLLKFDSSGLVTGMNLKPELTSATLGDATNYWGNTYSTGLQIRSVGRLNGVPANKIIDFDYAADTVAFLSETGGVPWIKLSAGAMTFDFGFTATQDCTIGTLSLGAAGIITGATISPVQLTADGSLPDGALSANVTLAGNVFNGVSQLVQTDGTGLLPSLDGSMLFNVNGSGITGGTFGVVNGENLTTLNASELATGTVPLTRLSGITNTQISASAAIVDTKLAQITTASKVSTSAITGTLGVANGGTGAPTFTANGVMIGNGTSAMTVTAEGATGKVLTGVTGGDPTWQDPAAGPGAYLGSFIASGTTYTTGANTTLIRVRMVAGGGGGGAATSGVGQSGGGGGGAAGGYAEATFTVTPSTGYTIQIGALGAGGNAANGSAGTDSTFTVNTGTAGNQGTLTAKGGAGGIQSAGSTSIVAVLGGVSSAISTNTSTNAGSVLGAGSAGEAGFVLAAALAMGGRGGSSQYGGCGRGRLTTGAGTNATNYGSGGGGATSVNNGGAAVGGDGAAGLIVVHEYK